MSIISKPKTFTAGAVAVSADMNSDLDTIFNDYNGNITNANLSASAAIADTKLANITSGGKVNISALTATSQAAGDLMYASSPSAYARLAAGTSSQVLVGGASAPVWGNVPAAALPADPFSAQLLHVMDEKANNTVGGTFTSGAWRTRDINTVKTNEVTGASLGSNQVTLPSGTYFMQARTPAFAVDHNVAKLYNVTDAVDVLIGSSGYSTAVTGGGEGSFINGRFTITAQKVFEIRHYCGSTYATQGFGYPCGFGVVEVYTEALIWKVA